MIGVKRYRQIESISKLRPFQASQITSMTDTITNIYRHIACSSVLFNVVYTITGYNQVNILTGREHKYMYYKHNAYAAQPFSIECYY